MDQRNSSSDLVDPLVKTDIVSVVTSPPSRNVTLFSGTSTEDSQLQNLIERTQHDAFDGDNTKAHVPHLSNVDKKALNYRASGQIDGPYPLQVQRASMSRQGQALLMKDMYIVSVAFMLLYSAFNGIQNVASSLFQDEGLGVTSYSCYYTFGIFSCFLTPICVRKCTPKWTLVVCLALPCLFLGYLLYPRMYTVIPCSALFGLSNGPLWAAGALYVSNAAFEYVSRTGKPVGPVLARFHSIWLLFPQTSQIVGNLVSSLVFHYGNGETTDYERGIICGVSICPSRHFGQDQNTVPYTITSINDDNFTSLSSLYSHVQYNSSNLKNTTIMGIDRAHKIYILGGVYIGMAVGGIILVSAFLSKFHPSTNTENLSSDSSISKQHGTRELLFSTLTLWKDVKLILLFPLAYVSGMHQGYLYADFTQTYVSCTVGVGWVGYIMTCFGVSTVTFSYIGGKLTKIIGRMSLFTIAYLIQTGIILTLILWSPIPGNLVPFFVIVFLWGICDAVWQPQTSAFISALFVRQQEASFANYRLLHNLGLAVTFGYSQALCVSTKFYIFLPIVTAAFICYITVEVLLKKSSKKTERHHRL